MTTTRRAPDASGRAAVRVPAAPPVPIALPVSAGDPCLDRFDAVIAAARSLGIDTAAADAVRTAGGERLGYPSDTYVVAFVGGTGVGKSSLLNALAGRSISAVSARRPTTSQPVAWLPPDRIDALGGLLEWLGVGPGDARATGSASLGNVAVLDLPDLDSTSEDHRRRVEAVLPRVDAVVWVTDPEKYADAVLHDDFLRTWLPRLDRQLIVVNKADRLAPADAERVRADLERDVARLARRDGRNDRSVQPAVVTTSARDDGAGDGAPSTTSGGVSALRTWLAAEVAAKAVVRARIRASIRDAVRATALAAGLPEPTDARGSPALPSLLESDTRQRALDDATSALLRIVDTAELQRQAVAAVRARARSRGAGPLGGVTSLLYRWSGREARAADPLGFLARWRDRGGLGRAVDPIRGALAEPLRLAPARVRGRLATAFDPASIEASLAQAVDRAVATRDEPAPTSGIWPVLGILQTLVTLGLVATVAWVVLWVLVKFPVDAVDLPLIGHAPTPLVALLALLAAGYLLARLLGAHAGWVGRRWARRLAADVRTNVARDVAVAAFADLDAVERDRARLAEAITAARRDCAGG